VNKVVYQELVEHFALAKQLEPSSRHLRQSYPEKSDSG
jgi:hypothetical protein